MITRHVVGFSPFIDIPDFRNFSTTPGSRVQRKDAMMTTDPRHIVRVAMSTVETFVYGALTGALLTLVAVIASLPKGI